jgi:F-box and leucine-rich repeat protein 1 (S-phase kinase-associated protein 2)
MDLGNRSLMPGALGNILSRGLIICRLAQARIPRPIFDEYSEGIDLKLQYLDLSLASIDKSSLTQLLAACRILKKLSLEQLEIDNDVCNEIAENSNLEVILVGIF